MNPTQCNRVSTRVHHNFPSAAEPMSPIPEAPTIIQELNGLYNILLEAESILLDANGTITGNARAAEPMPDLYCIDAQIKYIVDLAARIRDAACVLRSRIG